MDIQVKQRGKTPHKQTLNVFTCIKKLKDITKLSGNEI